ncbi:MAG TPA: MFS transporter [Alphaproteobacteria bacterium]|nr:MFS transporter [Alphaproteobacteria bacterium]
MSNLHPWVMWFFAVLFFSYQFIMRVFLGLCAPEIMHKFQIDASDFGLLASMYYYGYAGMQIPIAILLDRFGPRVIISICCLVCSIAIFLFYWTETWYVALFARFLIGAGSAAGFLGASKVITLWFPYHLYSRMVGLTFSIGLLGAIYGGMPVSHLITLYGWENVLLIIGTAGFVLTGLLFITIKPYKISFLHEPPAFLKDFKSLLANPTLLLLALANFLMVGSLEGFADVWGVPYLMTVYSFIKEDAAFVTSSIFTGMLFGGPILAYFADKFKASYQITGLCGLLMAGIFVSMLFSNGSFSYIGLSILMFIIGVLCCYQVLVFSIGTSLVSPSLRNITVAFLNCINMLGGSFFHTTIGYLMDTFWLGRVIEGQRAYESHAFQYALSIIPLTALIGGVMVYFLRRSIKETSHF